MGMAHCWRGSRCWLAAQQFLMQPLDIVIRHPGDVVADNAMSGVSFRLLHIPSRQLVWVVHIEGKQAMHHLVAMFLFNGEYRVQIKVLV